MLQQFTNFPNVVIPHTLRQALPITSLIGCPTHMCGCLASASPAYDWLSGTCGMLGPASKLSHWPSWRPASPSLPPSSLLCLPPTFHSRIPSSHLPLFQEARVVGEQQLSDFPLIKTITLYFLARLPCKPTPTCFSTDMHTKFCPW